jgi:hypothetical protein
MGLLSHFFDTPLGLRILEVFAPFHEVAREEIRVG